jgi:hypothetical protein
MPARGTKRPYGHIDSNNSAENAAPSSMGRRGGFLTVSSAMLARSQSSNPPSSSSSASLSSSGLSSSKAMISGGKGDELTELSCKIWRCNALSIEECCYMLTRQEQLPAAFVCADEDYVEYLSDVLRVLLHPVPVICVTLKSQRAHVQKNMKVLGLQPKAAICVSKHLTTFAESCLPISVSLPTVVHVGRLGKQEFLKRMELVARPSAPAMGTASTAAQIVVLKEPDTNNSSIPASSSSSPYVYNKKWMAVVQGRVSAAKKLVAAVAEGGQHVGAISKLADDSGFSDSAEDKERKLSIAGKITALKAKLKVQLSSKLSGCTHESDTIGAADNDPSLEAAAESAAADKSTTDTGNEFIKVIERYSKLLPELLIVHPAGSESGPKILRKKMIILGMITDSAVASHNLHDKAELGRSLALTRWLDGMSGFDVGCPWGAVRAGASCDCVSLAAREVVSACRDFVTQKSQKLLACKPSAPKEGGKSTVESGAQQQKAARSKKLVKKHHEQDMAPQAVMKASRQQQLQAPFHKDSAAPGVTNAAAVVSLTGLGWHPNHHPDNIEEWGGSFGKACGHNEVAMFTARPFAPFEVINTHICSARSPAPGNLGYDGCLEFLSAQCRWFQRSFVAWDDAAFYVIDNQGSVQRLRKEMLLKLPLKCLNQLMTHLKAVSVEAARGTMKVLSTCEAIEYILLLWSLRLGRSSMNRLVSAYPSKKLATTSMSTATDIQRLIVSFLLVEVN